LPDIVLPPSAALDNCVVVIELFAISLDPTAFAAIFPAVTALNANLPSVTACEAILAVVSYQYV
jgi:hypothetical protein